MLAKNGDSRHLDLAQIPSHTCLPSHSCIQVQAGWRGKVRRRESESIHVMAEREPNEERKMLRVRKITRGKWGGEEIGRVRKKGRARDRDSYPLGISLIKRRGGTVCLTNMRKKSLDSK